MEGWQWTDFILLHTIIKMGYNLMGFINMSIKVKQVLVFF